MIKSYLLAAVTIFFWGITFVCTKSLLHDFSALELLLFRFVVAYLGLFAIYPKREKFIPKDNLYFALAGLTGVVLYQYLENIAINFTTASNVSVIVSICPMFTAIIAQLFFKEKHVTVKFIIGFVISICGIFLVSLNANTKFSINPKGDILALLAAISWGFYSLFISIINSRHYNLFAATRRIFFFAVLFMIPLVLVGMRIPQDSALAGTMAFSFDKTLNGMRFSKLVNLLNILFLGLIASGFCFSAWNKVCNELGTVKISTGLYMIPIITTFFAFFFLKEPITLMGATGTLITIAGLFISSRK